MHSELLALVSFTSRGWMSHREREKYSFLFFCSENWNDTRDARLSRTKSNCELNENRELVARLCIFINQNWHSGLLVYYCAATAISTVHSVPFILTHSFASHTQEFVCVCVVYGMDWNSMCDCVHVCVGTVHTPMCVGWVRVGERCEQKRRPTVHVHVWLMTVCVCVCRSIGTICSGKRRERESDIGAGFNAL